MTEKLPITDNMIQQAIFGICFCDLKKKDSKFHRECYGNYAFVFTKDWGIRHGISPVRYVHENSTGIRKEYRQINNYYRNILKASRNNSENIDFELNYLFTLILQIQGKFTKHDLITEANSNSDFLKEIQELGSEYDDFHTYLSKDQKYLETFSKYIHSLIYRITELHNELFERDFFMRNYAEDFTCPKTNESIKNKVLYDEREWRAIKIKEIGRNNDSRMEELKKSTVNGFLPENDNIKFNKNDLIAILINSKEEKEELINLSKSDSLLLDFNGNSNKIVLWDDYTD